MGGHPRTVGRMRLAVLALLTGIVSLLGGFLWSATTTWQEPAERPALPPMQAVPFAADAGG